MLIDTGLSSTWKGLRSGPLEWTRDHHFRTRQHDRMWRWDTSKNLMVRAEVWVPVDVKK